MPIYEVRTYKIIREVTERGEAQAPYVYEDMNNGEYFKSKANPEDIKKAMSLLGESEYTITKTRDYREDGDKYIEEEEIFVTSGVKDFRERSERKRNEYNQLQRELADEYNEIMPKRETVLNLSDRARIVVTRGEAKYNPTYSHNIQTSKSFELEIDNPSEYVKRRLKNNDKDVRLYNFLTSDGKVLRKQIKEEYGKGRWNSEAMLTDEEIKVLINNAKNLHDHDDMKKVRESLRQKKEKKFEEKSHHESGSKSPKAMRYV